MGGAKGGAHKEETEKQRDREMERRRDRQRQRGRETVKQRHIHVHTLTRYATTTQGRATAVSCLPCKKRTGRTRVRKGKGAEASCHAMPCHAMSCPTLSVDLMRWTTLLAITFFLCVYNVKYMYYSRPGIRLVGVV